MMPILGRPIVSKRICEDHEEADATRPGATKGHRIDAISRLVARVQQEAASQPNQLMEPEKIRTHLRIFE